MLGGQYVWRPWNRGGLDDSSVVHHPGPGLDLDGPRQQHAADRNHRHLGRRFRLHGLCASARPARSGAGATAAMASSGRATCRIPPIATPVLDASAAAVTGFASISVSYYNACGLKTDNTVWCWGDNYYGEIGNGTDAMNGTTSRYVLHPTQTAFPVNTVVTSVVVELLLLHQLREHERRERLLLGQQQQLRQSGERPRHRILERAIAGPDCRRDPAHERRESDELVEQDLCPPDRRKHLVLAGHLGEPDELLRGAAGGQSDQGERCQRRRAATATSMRTTRFGSTATRRPRIRSPAPDVIEFRRSGRDGW